jgi:hypothetical protein
MPCYDFTLVIDPALIPVRKFWALPTPVV